MSGIGAGLAALNIGAKLTGAKAVLAKVPRQVWIALAVVAALAAGYAYHQHKVHQLIAAAEKRGADAENKRLAVLALKLKHRVDGMTTKISTALRSKNDETNRRIAAAADDFRLHGPGKAVCPVRAIVPAGTGRHVAQGGIGDAAGSQVPPDERAAVPWGWLVTRAEEHDLDRAEVLTWREWYRKMVASWPKP